MRALGKQFDRAQQFGDFARCVVMAEYRQPEGRFGNKNVARHQFERRAGRVRQILVVAGSDDAHAFALDLDLGRAEHMPGRMKAHRRIAELDRLAVAHGLRRAGEIVAVAQPHDVERFLRRQNRAMPGPGVVGVAMRDQGLVDRAGRIDMKAAGLATNTRRRRNQDIFCAHCA